METRFQKTLNAPHDFEIVCRAQAGMDLDILEETWIRNGGGLQKEGGTLLNGRHEMIPERYLSGVNQRLREYQGRVLLQNGLANGTVQTLNHFK